MQNLNQKKILIVDDNPDIHGDFRRILSKGAKDQLDNIEKILFEKVGHKGHNSFPLPDLEIDSAYQGKEAALLVKAAFHSNQPYVLAFVDIRMPPGWDGINTIKELWKIDSELQIVICTAYSDFSWQEMFEELSGSENFLILSKPFEAVEARQLVASLTKKWEYKRRIQNQVESLESLVYERTEELRNALTLAEDANKLKNEFLRNVSHELRTPLNSIIGFTELIYHDKVAQRDLKEFYNDILSSSKYLLQMIDDIFDMSRLESATIKLRPEKVNLHLLCDEIKDMFQPQLNKKNIKWNSVIHSSLVHVIIDPEKLKQVVRHYVSNAIKFSPEGSEIELSIKSVGNDKFCIEVTDTGIGISEEDAKKLFIPFQQLDLSMSKKYRGTGLGLALSRRIVEYQNGEVGVKSTPGKGSTFYAILPINANLKPSS